MDGTKVDGVVTLREALVRDPEIFVGAFTEKLLTYAIGRGVAHYDMPVVRAIVRDARRHELLVLVDRVRHRRKRAVPDADEGGGGGKPAPETRRPDVSELYSRRSK